MSIAGYISFMSIIFYSTWAANKIRLATGATVTARPVFAFSIVLIFFLLTTMVFIADCCTIIYQHDLAVVYSSILLVKVGLYSNILFRLKVLGTLDAETNKFNNCLKVQNFVDKKTARKIMLLDLFFLFSVFLFPIAIFSIRQ